MDSTPSQKSALEKFNSKLMVPLMAILTALSTFYYTQLDSKLKYESLKLDTLRQSLMNASLELDNYLKRQQFDRQTNFDLFKEIKEAVKSKDEAHQKVLLVFIDQMLGHDSVMRQKYINVLAISGTNTVREEVKQIALQETVFYAEQVQLSKAKLTEKRLRVDVFYLEETQAISQPLASSVAKLLPPEEFVVRVRLLPRGVNARPGYQVTGNQIRVEASEISEGQKLLGLIDKAFVKEKPRLRKVSNVTDNYVSIFISNP